jgi:hypothetical protein
MGGRAYRPGVVRVGDLPMAERASCGTERSRGALSYGPRTGRGAVEAFPSGVPRTSQSWSAVEVPVELASYEMDPVRGRGVLPFAVV